ncbi:MAG: hypothetical protein AB7G21_08920 [Dehalococcoidia bacterium]
MSTTSKWAALAATAVGLLVLGAVAFLWPARVVAEPGVTVGTRIGTDGSAELDLRVDRLEPGAPYLVRMSVPRTGGVAASVGVLGRVTADEAGVARLVTRTVRVGATGAEVPLEAEFLDPPGREITVVSESGDTVASVTVSVPR